MKAIVLLHFIGDEIDFMPDENNLIADENKHTADEMKRMQCFADEIVKIQLKNNATFRIYQKI